METEKSSEPQSAWATVASSAWLVIRICFRILYLRLRTVSRLWPGARPSESSQRDSEKSEKLRPELWQGEYLDRYREASLRHARQEMTRRSGSDETMKPRVLIWSEREQAFVPPSNDTESGEP